MTSSRPVVAAAAALATGAIFAVSAICLWNGAMRIGRPFPGFLVAENRTVLSVARSGWSLESASRTLFSQVTAIDELPVTSAKEIQSVIEGAPSGTRFSYRLRKGGDVFAATVPTQTFTAGDFAALYGTYAIVGAFFAASGLLALWRERGTARIRPATLAFFLVCQSAGATLATAGDVYGPHWFTRIYFTAQCLVAATVLHLAASFPRPLGFHSRSRRLALGLVYGASLGLAVALAATANDLLLFLPLVYALYLLLANAIFLYAARLAIELSLPAGTGERGALWRALGGIVLVVVLPVMIFLVYPTLDRTISPFALVGPFALFPLFTASALERAARAGDERPASSVRLRLSLLFLGAVETSFLIAVAVFWLNTSRAGLLERRTLQQRQASIVERLIAQPAGRSGLALDLGGEAPAGLATLASLAATTDETALIARAAEAAGRGDSAAERAALVRLRALYAGADADLASREAWLRDLDPILLGGLLALAALQAVVFTLAVRRWLIGPIESIAAATEIIATGDLAHRIELDASEELTALADSVNDMAASLQSINRRVDEERAARQRAALEARDSERRRLARELHDGILQDLSAVRLRLESSGRGDSSGEIAEVIGALRRVVDDLRPSGLGELSLEHAIAGHARVVAFARGVRLSLDLAGAAAVPDWAMRDVFRIAQEASANAVRHGAPSELRIRLAENGGEITLEVEDDGGGFEPDRVALGSGVHGMRERAAALGGDFEISGRPGAGVLVRLSFRPPATTSRGTVG